MKTLIVTGSAGLVGSEAVEFFAPKFDRVVGIDNDFRKSFFGEEASTEWNRKKLETIKNYAHFALDIRDKDALETIFKENGSSVSLVIHAAAQPSHDWAAKDPLMDFGVNAVGTLNLLELTRRHSPKAVFIFTSTNKVYGDTPNRLPLEEKKTRWEIQSEQPYFKNGIDETMSIDQSKHSIFGASKAAADLLVQEYGLYFGMKTGTFRCGCVTGPKHSGTMLHGFLSYLMKCAITGHPYEILGYKGKQVRDNIHSFDLINMFWHFYQDPRPGAVYNAGGGRHSNCSLLEAVSLCEKITGKPMNVTYSEPARVGDHQWWISDVSKFKNHYPHWSWRYDILQILKEIHTSLLERPKLVGRAGR